MKLFELFATLGLDTTKFENAVKKAGKGFNALKDGVFTAANGIANGANKIIDTTERFAGRAAIVVGSAATAFAGITIKAMSAAGELEQQVGGAAQVFGDYAAEIERWADAAFEFTGLSKYEYLQSANVLGSLLQGTGFRQDEALDLTTQVMQRAADVASIMGINTADAIYAVTGAAKGNFTMMDNLGVAMNATTIEAYALSKGTNKAYAEMTNLEKVGYAYQMFLEKTAYATGNYARENDTLVGSISTAKAAMRNFISGSGSAADVVKFVKNAGKVISKNLTLLLPTFITGLSEMLGALAPELPALMEALLPSIFDGANILIGGLVDVLPQLMRSATSSMPVITGGLQRLITGMLGGAPQFLEAASALFNGLMDGFMQLVPQIGALAGEIAPALLEGVLIYKSSMLMVGLEVLKSILEGLASDPERIATAISDVVTKIGTWVTENAGTIISSGLEILKALMRGLSTAESVLAISDGISSVIVAIVDWIGTPENLASLLSSALAIVGAIVKGIISPESLYSLSAAAESIVSSLLGWLGEKASEVVEGIRSWWSGIVESVGSLAINASLHINKPTYSASGANSIFAPWYVRENAATPKASGLPYVPYNEFPAMLHAGEAVLTRQEAEGWRSGQGGTVDAEAIASAVARAVTNALDGAAVTMSGQAVGNLVTDTVSRNIARAARRKGLATV